MKYLLTLLFLYISLNGFSQTKETQKINKDSLDWEQQGNVFLEGEYLNKLEVSKRDGSMRLYSDIKRDHRIFGYEKPDVKSRRKILFSVFTFDVKDNPCNCKFGSFYDTSSMDGIIMQYVKKEKGFVKVKLLRNNEVLDTIYFEQKWIEFE